jgi:hypothetical protein
MASGAASVPPPIPPIQSKTWWRKYWWLVLLIVLGILGLIGVGGGVFAMFRWIDKEMRGSEGYRRAMTLVRADPQVVAALGEPIDDSGFISGNTTSNSHSQSLSIDVPLRGPKGRATVVIVATGRDDEWKFDTLSVTVEATHQIIDLRSAANDAAKPDK